MIFQWSWKLFYFIPVCYLCTKCDYTLIKYSRIFSLSHFSLNDSEREKVCMRNCLRSKSENEFNRWNFSCQAWKTWCWNKRRVLFMKSKFLGRKVLDFHHHFYIHIDRDIKTAEWKVNFRKRVNLLMKFMQQSVTWHPSEGKFLFINLWQNYSPVTQHKIALHLIISFYINDHQKWHNSFNRENWKWFSRLWFIKIIQ